MRLLLAALIALPVAGFAAEPGPAPISGLVDISKEEWTRMTEGNTLTYTIGGAFWARERYHPGSDRVTLQFYDGMCLDGTWSWRDGLYCFDWDTEGVSCFRHARLGGEVLILETRDGVETGAIQVMSGVSDLPVSCGPAAIS